MLQESKKGPAVKLSPFINMAGAAGIEPAVPESKSGALTAWPRPNFNYFNNRFSGDWFSPLATNPVNPAGVSLNTDSASCRD